MHALVMSGQETVCTLIEKCLSGYGFQVATAFNRQSGLQLVASKTYTIAVVDISLRDGSGLDAIPCLRRYQPEMFIIATSTRARWALSLELFEAGADDHLLKPFSREQLCNHIAQASKALAD